MGFEMDNLPGHVLATVRRGKVRERRVDARRVVEALDDLGNVIASREYNAAEDAARLARAAVTTTTTNAVTAESRLRAAIATNRAAIAGGGLTAFQESVLKQLIGIERLLLRELDGTD